MIFPYIIDYATQQISLFRSLSICSKLNLASISGMHRANVLHLFQGCGIS